MVRSTCGEGEEIVFLYFDIAMIIMAFVVERFVLESFGW